MVQQPLCTLIWSRSYEYIVKKYFLLKAVWRKGLSEIGTTEEKIELIVNVKIVFHSVIRRSFGKSILLFPNEHRIISWNTTFTFTISFVVIGSCWYCEKILFMVIMTRQKLEEH